MTPTALTLRHLRRLGYLAAVVEAWIPKVNKRRDLWGIADVLALHPRDKAVLLVQCTSDSHVPDRLRRIQARPELPAILEAGVSVEAWGWCCLAGHWKLRRIALRAEDLAGVPIEAPRSRRKRKGDRQALLAFDAPGPAAADG